jgi:adenine-specific DNA-methyltransferase
MEKMEGTSLNLEQENIEQIKKLFPSVVTEGKVDFEKLRLILGDEVDDRVEKYQFTWNGKSKAIKLAQTPSTATLRPVKEESVNWDTTENLYIEGDNLEVLKLLQKTYFGKIKMIYIDPPYNTGGDFVYKDDFKDSIANYKEQTNQTHKSNADTSGRYHTDWLNMMYPRLILSRNLLKEDGVIFISIDDHELHNLIKVCNEIYGESNFLGTFSRATGTTTGQDANKVGSSLDYCVAFRKTELFTLRGLPLDAKDKKRFNEFDEKGRYSKLQLRKTGNADKREDRPNMFYEITAPDGSLVYPFGPSDYLSRWRVSKSSFKELVDSNMIVWKKDDSIDSVVIDGFEKSKWIPYVKYYLEGRTKQVSNLLIDIEGNKKGSIQLKTLFKEKDIFTNPKPLGFIELLVNISMDDSENIVLDFFSGSATTGHAIMNLNNDDNGRRRFILVQIPEKTSENSAAKKAGFSSISDIGIQRLKRASMSYKSASYDLGFRVFKLDATNIKEWDSSTDISNNTLFDQIQILKSERTDFDVLFEILLKYGVFDEKVEDINVNDKTYYNVSNGYMIVNLNDKVNDRDIKAISELKPQVVIFLESAFIDDNAKINAEHTLKRAGVQDIKCI